MKLIAACLAFLAGIIAFMRGDARRDEKREAELVEAEAKSRDLERMYDAQVALGDDPDVLRDFLRVRGHTTK